MAKGTHTKNSEHTVSHIIRSLEDDPGVNSEKGLKHICSSVNKAAGQLATNSSDAFKYSGAHRFSDTTNTQQKRLSDILARLAAEAEEQKAAANPAAPAETGEEIEQGSDRTSVLMRTAAALGVGVATMVLITGSTSPEHRPEDMRPPAQADLVIAPGMPSLDSSMSQQN